MLLLRDGYVIPWYKYVLRGGFGSYGVSVSIHHHPPLTGMNICIVGLCILIICRVIE